MKKQPNQLVINILAILRNIALLGFLYIFIINTEVTIHFNGEKGLKYFISQVESAVKAVKFIRAF